MLKEFNEQNRNFENSLLYYSLFYRSSFEVVNMINILGTRRGSFWFWLHSHKMLKLQSKDFNTQQFHLYSLHLMMFVFIFWGLKRRHLQVATMTKSMCSCFDFFISKNIVS